MKNLSVCTSVDIWRNCLFFNNTPLWFHIRVISSKITEQIGCFIDTLLLPSTQKTPGPEVLALYGGIQRWLMDPLPPPPPPKKKKEQQYVKCFHDMTHDVIMCTRRRTACLLRTQASPIPFRAVNDNGRFFTCLTRQKKTKHGVRERRREKISY